MSRRVNRKRKEDKALVSEDEQEERKDEKRSRGNDAAASSSSAAAAGASPARPQLAPSSAASSSPPAAAAWSSSSAAAASSRSARADVEDVMCGVCWVAFECTDDAGHLPRTVPCGHLMCTQCIRQNLTLTPGSVPCPLEHGPQQIRIPDGSAAAAMSTVDDWIRLLPPANDLIAAIRNQHHLMTRLGQQGAECSHEGCKGDVTHYCPDCGDLCAAHERKLHALQPFQSHKPKTVAIADKAACLRDQNQSKFAAPAAKIRSEAAARFLQQQQQTWVARDQLKQLEAQLQQKREEVEAKEESLSALKQTVDRMQTANDSAVLEMEADRLEASRPTIDSAVLSALPDERVAALQTFLGAARLLSNGKLVYRASRDGFAAKDWWRMCGGKSNLLTLVRVKGNGFVFGAFTPFQWPADAPTKNENIADPTGTAFLVSLVNDHNRAVKLRLKGYQKAMAGSLYPGYGPNFGNDVALMLNGKSATDPVGNYAYPASFEFDSVADGGAPIEYDKTLLAGDDGRGKYLVLFAAAEIECWQL